MNTNGWWLIGQRTGVAVPRTCKKWTCPACRRTKRLAALVALQHGLAVFAEAGHEVHCLTITDGHGDLDFASFYKAWDCRVRPWLRRHGHAHAYASALELQPESGRLHCHALLIAPLGSSGFVDHAALSPVLERARLGFGWLDHITDVPVVAPSLRDFVKTSEGGEFSVPTPAAGRIGSYMAKAHELSELAGKTRTRLRPFRVSRNWPLNLTAAGEALRREMYGDVEPEGWQPVRERDLARWLVPLREEQQLYEHRDRVFDEATKLHSVMSRVVQSADVRNAAS